MRAGLLTAALLLASLPLRAQPSDGAAPSDAKHPTVVGATSNGSQDAEAERMFVRQVALADLLAEQMGRLASRRAHASSVVEFGRMTANDAAQDRQALAAAAVGLTALPDMLGPPQRQVLSRLEGATGPGFDDAYLSAVLKNQGEAAKLMQAEAKGGRSQALIFYAQRQLPVVQAHVDEATDLQVRAPGHSKGPPEAVVDPGAQQRLQQQETARLKRTPSPP